MMFLMKLNVDFGMVRTNVLMMQPLPTLIVAYRLCAQEESHKQVSNMSTHVEPMAFAAEKRRYNNKYTDKLRIPA